MRCLWIRRSSRQEIAALDGVAGVAASEGNPLSPCMSRDCPAVTNNPYRRGRDWLLSETSGSWALIAFESMPQAGSRMRFKPGLTSDPHKRKIAGKGLDRIGAEVLLLCRSGYFASPAYRGT